MTAAERLAAVFFALAKGFVTESAVGGLVPDASQLARCSPEAQARWKALAASELGRIVDPGLVDDARREAARGDSGVARVKLADAWLAALTGHS